MAPWAQFSQSEDLTVRLRNILHDYAFGPGVFRELLQNADDACARKFAVLADSKHYAGGTGLIDPRLEQWQGPAVCAFNDAAFSDADFEGICRVGASGKRGDHTKIGHYGLGFNSTYHLTDVVSFVSRDRLCIFDPHQAHLPDGLPGLQLPLHWEEQERYSEQLAPFEAVAAACGVEVWPLKGAIFRLPLRTPELAARSSICGESHTWEEVVGVLHALLVNAHELLLFLQSVESIEVLVRPPGDALPRRLGSVSLRTAGEAALAHLRQQRRLFAAAPAQGRAPRCERYAFAVEHEYKQQEAAEDEREGGGTDDSKYTKVTTAWLIAVRAEPVTTAAVAAAGPAASGDELPKEQCGAVAVQLWPPRDPSQGPAASPGASCPPPLDGQAFCFLPLSLHTGFPAHLSANFALSANRRDLWRRSDDRSSSHSNRRAAWNEALLSGTLPRAYADALEVLAGGAEAAADKPAVSQDRQGRAKGGAKCRPERVDILTLLPHEGPWSSAALQQAAAQEGAGSAAGAVWASWPQQGKGAFEQLPAQLVGEIVARNSEVFWDGGKSQFVGAKSTMLCAAADFAALDVRMKDALSQILVGGSRRSIVHVPDSIAEPLAEAKGLTWLGPQPLATALRASASAAQSLQAAAADAIVAYLLQPAKGGIHLLYGLRIAPLIGGGLGCFDRPVPAVEELWWTEDAEMQELLPSRPFIDPASETFRLLKSRVTNTSNPLLNIRLLNSRALQTILPALVPPAWRGRRAVTVQGNKVLVDDEPAEVVQSTAEKVQASANKADRSKASVKAKAATRKQVKPRASQAAAGGRSRASGGGGSDVLHVDNLMRRTWWADEYGDEDWEDWAEEDWQDQDWDEDDGAGSRGRAAGPPAKAAPGAATELTACICTTVQHLQQLLRRCSLLWQMVERAHEKGANPISLLHDLPCVPVEEAAPCAAEGASVAPAVLPALISVQEAVRRRALCVEDFPPQERQVMEACGVTFIRAGKRLRGELRLDKAASLAALSHVCAERWKNAPAAPPTSTHARLLMGMRPLQMALEEAKPLRSLVRGWFRRNLVPKDYMLLESLPIFETQGGRFAVPLAPSSARVITPSDDWDDLLRPVFGDFMLSVEGEAGEFFEEVRLDRCAVGRFLSEFMAPRVGMLDQALCVKFLEAVASLGAAPWKKPGAPKELALVAQACTVAPLVVFPDSEDRKRCSDLVDPCDGDAASLRGVSALLPPPEYRSPLVLSVMRSAGLKSLADEGLFLKAAFRAGVMATMLGATQEAKGLLSLLGQRIGSLKWSSKTFASLAKCCIFPALDMMETTALVYPPTAADATEVAQPPAGPGADSLGSRVKFVALDGPCTLHHHAEVAWTQLTLLHPQAFVGWPPGHLSKFGALKDPPHIETVVANLAEVARRWCAEPSPCSDEVVKRRQAIVQKHLLALRVLPKRSHSTQIMVQGQLSRAAFVALDDGTLTRPSDIFVQLHTGGASDDEEEGQQGQQTQGQHKKSISASPWALPAYLRPFRRLLIGCAGPAAGGGKRTAPTIHVQDPPSETDSMKFLTEALNKPELSDIEFATRTREGEARVVYAHRIMLAAASEHFHSSFTSGLMGILGPTGRYRIELPDWAEHRPFLWMMAYLYMGFNPTQAHKTALRLDAAASGAGNLPAVTPPHSRRKIADFVDADIGDDLCCLLRLSEFYKLEHLKSWAEYRLQSLLTGENLLAVSTHAYFCSAHQLLRLCVFHMQQCYSELAATPEWEELEPAIKERVLQDCGGDPTAAPTADDTARQGVR